MKIAIGKRSALGASWSPRDILADKGTLDAEVARAAANVRVAEKRMVAAMRRRQDILAREQSLIDSGDLKIVAESYTPATPTPVERRLALADAWADSASVGEAAEKAGMKPDTAAHAAVRARRRGVPLPSLRKDISVHTLAAMKEAAQQDPKTAAVRFRDPVLFVAAWQACERVADVARLCGLNEVACRARAAAYRRMGIPMKLYRPGTHRGGNPVSGH
jgi:hypothetical protein